MTNTPSELEMQPFFLVVDAETGEIYCAHQEYSASDRRLVTRSKDEERMIAIAVKANPACRPAKDRLRVFPVMCPPSTNFARHVVELETGQLIERKPSSEATEPDAIAVDFE
jgi:hypothetical protein